VIPIWLLTALHYVSLAAGLAMLLLLLSVGWSGNRPTTSRPTTGLLGGSDCVTGVRSSGDINERHK